MLFNSYEFIFLFLPISFFVYFLLNKKGHFNYSKLFLVFASLFFYSWWNIVYLPLILISMVFNFSIGNIFTNDKIKSRTKKIVLGLGIFGNLSLLGYFKYSDFFIQNYNIVTSSDVNLLNLALPLAISFFTFQQISYLVDSYKGFTSEYKIIDYMVFVTFFPQLIAGPIVHHKEMMPQFKDEENRKINYNNISKGLFIFSLGLFKKVAIADSFASFATNGFDIEEKLSFIDAWITSLSYTFQLYYDFSGYTDMAIGLALLFNIRLPLNFNSPYKALNIQDFWRRWHMTLSRFLRDYIYIPLGGNKTGEIRVYTNLLITFILAGIWHGAGWTFILWGLLHALAIIVYKLWSKLEIKLNIVLAWFITFNFVNITWVFFRAKDFDNAIKVLKGLVDIRSLNIMEILGHKYIIFGLFVILLVSVFAKNSIEYLRDFKTDVKTLVFASILFSISVICLTRVSEFLYFNF